MAQSTTLAHAGLHHLHTAEVSETPKLELDPGPWLFLAAPVSFALTFLLVCWASLSSF